MLLCHSGHLDMRRCNPPNIVLRNLPTSFRSIERVSKYPALVGNRYRGRDSGVHQPGSGCVSRLVTARPNGGHKAPKGFCEHTLTTEIRDALLLGLNEAPIFYRSYGNKFELRNDCFLEKEENDRTKKPMISLAGLIYSFTWVALSIYIKYISLLIHPYTHTCTYAYARLRVCA
jgi:hypothetical protein